MPAKDENQSAQDKFITSFGDSGKGSKSTSSKAEKDAGIDSTQKGMYAFIGGIGFGIIALLFIFVMPTDAAAVGLIIGAMALLGIKAVFLVYPRIVIVHTTSITVKTRFLTAIFIMAWVIYIALAFSYLADHPDLSEEPNIIWIKMVAMSILTAISVFFLSMTMARR